jgi:4-cresol dehydrogenase (hydroxylating) flavoprotein subunit
MEKNSDDFFREINNFLKENQYIKKNAKQSEKYHNACILVQKEIWWIVFPENTKELQELVLLANKFNIKLYPISIWNNWGYGTRNPIVDDSIIVDLSKMDKILDFNDTLWYVRIEPGVTQDKLSKFLLENNSKFQMDPTGSSPQTSVLANSLERGFWIGLHNNHFENLANLEVVLPKWDILSTGFGHYEKSKNKDVYKYGIWPYIDGLFSQSNLWIVTAWTIHLAPKFEHLELMAIKFDDDKKLSEVIDLLQELKMQKICQFTINVLHKKRVLSTKNQFPFNKTNKTYLDENLLEELWKEMNVSEWNIITTLQWSKVLVALQKKEITKKLKLVSLKPTFITEKKLDFIYKYKIFFGVLMKKILNLDVEVLYETLKKTFLIFNWIPSTVSMKSSYYRSHVKYSDKDPDPARDNWGLYWISPVLPFTWKDVESAYKIWKKICEKYEFDFAPTYSLATERFIDNTIPLMFDKSNKQEWIRAEKCYREMISEFKQNWYMIYRSGITSMDLVVDDKDMFWEFKKEIKSIIDPNNVIAPGKYELL